MKTSTKTVGIMFLAVFAATWIAHAPFAQAKEVKPVKSVLSQQQADGATAKIKNSKEQSEMLTRAVKAKDVAQVRAILRRNGFDTGSAPIDLSPKGRMPKPAQFCISIPGPAHIWICNWDCKACMQHD